MFKNNNNEKKNENDLYISLYLKLALELDRSRSAPNSISSWKFQDICRILDSEFMITAEVHYVYLQTERMLLRLEVMSHMICLELGNTLPFTLLLGVYVRVCGYVCFVCCYQDNSVRLFDPISLWFNSDGNMRVDVISLFVKLRDIRSVCLSVAQMKEEET